MYIRNSIMIISNNIDHNWRLINIIDRSHQFLLYTSSCCEFSTTTFDDLETLKIIFIDFDFFDDISIIKKLLPYCTKYKVYGIYKHFTYPSSIEYPYIEFISPHTNFHRLVGDFCTNYKYFPSNHFDNDISTLIKFHIINTPLANNLIGYRYLKQILKIVYYSDICLYSPQIIYECLLNEFDSSTYALDKAFKDLLSTSEHKAHHSTMNVYYYSIGIKSIENITTFKYFTAFIMDFIQCFVNTYA